MRLAEQCLVLVPIVNVDLSKLLSKTKRINITVPARVLVIADKAAAREGETLSGLLARAALSYVERHSKEQ